MPTLADFPTAQLVITNNRPIKGLMSLTWQISWEDRYRFAEMVISDDPRFHHPERPELVVSEIRIRSDSPSFDPALPGWDTVLAEVFFVPASWSPGR